MQLILKSGPLISVQICMVDFCRKRSLLGGALRVLVCMLLAIFVAACISPIGLCFAFGYGFGFAFDAALAYGSFLARLLCP